MSLNLYREHTHLKIYILSDLQLCAELLKVLSAANCRKLKGAVVSKVIAEALWSRLCCAEMSFLSARSFKKILKTLYIMQMAVD